MPPSGSMSNKRCLTSLDLKAKVVRLWDGWKVSDRLTACVDYLLSKWSDSRSALPTDSCTHQSTTLTNKRQWRTRAEHRRLESLPPLLRGLDIHKDIPVSVTKFTLGLRVGFISSHLTVVKLFPVNPGAITGPPNMSLLLEAKSVLHWSLNQACPCYVHGWPWLVHYVQPALTDVRSKPQHDCPQEKCCTRADPVLHHIQYSKRRDVSGKFSY